MTNFSLIRKLISYFNLESEVDDFDKIHDTILKDIEFKGTNLWILIFAIIVASVGLNMNSTAVIIGAMLISPLMGPINGMGYSIATYNFPLFRKALMNFSFAVGASLVASTAYFALSPISTAHSELLARTSPTIYDVLIALFGGLAGIVAISSRLKGNVIPGVAIATALMPPLCTAGYGLATGQFLYFFGAFYLFMINTVFIAIASVAISQLLKFPIRTIVEHAQKKIVNRWISIIISLMIIPSIYFGYNLVQKERFVENANKYVRNISVIEENYLLKSDINPNKRTITLVYGGASMTDFQKNAIVEKATDFSLKNASILFQKGLSFDAMDNKNKEVDDLKAEINRLSLKLQEKDKLLTNAGQSKVIGKQILAEIKSFYPKIISCSYAESSVYNEKSVNPGTMHIIVFTINDKVLKKGEKDKIEDWLRAKLKKDNITVYYEFSKK